MLLGHHAFPLAAGNVGVVGSTEHGVTLEAALHLGGPAVGVGAVLRGQLAVHGLGIVHVVEVGHGLDGEEHQLTVEVAALGGHQLQQPQGAQLKTGIVVGHLPPFAGLDVIGVGIEHFGCYARHVLAVAVIDVGRLAGLRAAHVAAEEAGGVVGHRLLGVLLGVPCHVHKQLYGVFHGLEVAHVENPHALYAEVVGQLQLLKHLLRLRDVEPLRVARSTDIVYMVVESPSTGVLTLLGVGHAAHVAPVVVAEQHNHVVGHAHAFVVVVQHLFI